MYYDFENYVLIDPGSEGEKQYAMGGEAYINSVRNVIRKIKQTDTGRKLFRTLQMWQRGIRITPLQLIPIHPGDKCGEGGGGLTTDIDGNNLIETRANANPLQPWTPMRKFPVNATIKFTPERFTRDGGCTHRYSDKTTHDFVPGPDEVLVHELVHGIRYVTRTLEQKVRPGAMSNLFEYDELEEFIAAVGESIYQSEMKLGHTQWGHQAMVVPEKSLQDSFEFYKASKTVFEWVDRWCRSNPHFTLRLSKVKAQFNPLTAYYKDKKKCAANSASWAALNRDVKAAEKNGILNYFKAVTPRYPAFFWQSFT